LAVIYLHSASNRIGIKLPEPGSNIRASSDVFGGALPENRWCVGPVQMENWCMGINVVLRLLPFCRAWTWRRSVVYEGSENRGQSLYPSERRIIGACNCFASVILGPLLPSVANLEVELLRSFSDDRLMATLWKKYEHKLLK
jgi:hypothetical protein